MIQATAPVTSSWWSWSYAAESLPAILEGLGTTVVATVLGAILAYALGLVFALLRRSRWRIVRTVTYWVVEFIRTTPLVGQLFFLYFVLPQLGISFSALVTGVIGLGLHYAAYTSEVYRAGIEGVPPGQWEASTALSLPALRTWTSVILPQAIPRVLPALGNYTIALFKETPLLFTISVAEMVTAAYGLGGRNLRYVEPLTIVGLLFLVLSIISALLVQLLERRLGQRHA